MAVAAQAEEDDGGYVQIKSSQDPGLYLCSYIFRAALLEAEKHGESGEPKDLKKRVLFLHVPPEGRRYGIQTGRHVVMRIAEGMVRDGEGLREPCA